ncbi:hypothetical protein DMUE_4698 [Dictyocoela muelleri]|nr:hypothetical protein DMUE_4698 [Dictyocoela muelleri]
MVRPKKCIDNMRYDELVIYCIRKDRRIALLQDWGFIPAKLRCSKCGLYMKLSKKKNCSSGFAWRCKRPCLNKKSIYENSYFSECRIDFLKFIKFLYLYFYYDIGPKKPFMN